MRFKRFIDKPILLLGLVIAFFSLTSCQTVKTFTDYEVTTEFSEYTTFAFFDDMETGLSELDEKRVQSIVEEALKDQGLSASSKNMDFLVNFYADTHESTHRHNMHIGIGAIGGHVAGNVGSGIPIDSHKRILSLTVELVDAQTNELFWQGVAEAKLKPNQNPEERTEFFKKLVTKLLKEYPPRD